MSRWLECQTCPKETSTKDSASSHLPWARQHPSSLRPTPWSLHHSLHSSSNSNFWRMEEYLASNFNHSHRSTSSRSNRSSTEYRQREHLWSSTTRPKRNGPIQAVVTLSSRHQARGLPLKIGRTLLIASKSLPFTWVQRLKLMDSSMLTFSNSNSRGTCLSQIKITSDSCIHTQPSRSSTQPIWYSLRAHN